jgi:hypothetical protein
MMLYGLGPKRNKYGNQAETSMLAAKELLST